MIGFIVVISAPVANLAFGGMKSPFFADINAQGVGSGWFLYGRKDRS